jgi:hypothetical protein
MLVLVVLGLSFWLAHQPRRRDRDGTMGGAVITELTRDVVGPAISAYQRDPTGPFKYLADTEKIGPYVDELRHASSIANEDPGVEFPGA